MNAHPGSEIQWQGSTYTVLDVYQGYVALADAFGNRREVLLAALEQESEVNGSTRASRLGDLRILDSLCARDRREVDIWLEELESLDVRYGQGQTRAEAREEVAEILTSRLGRSIGGKTVYRQWRALDEQGVVGLLDGRRFGLPDKKVPAVDERLIGAILDVFDGETDESTGTRERAHWRVARRLEELYGPDVVSVPSRSTMYRLANSLERGRHTFGDATNRRSHANRPDRVFFAREGLRPGELVMIDTTRMEVKVNLGTKKPKRPDLTIMLDAATRSVIAAIVTVRSRSIDLIVVLARALVPYSRRPESMHMNRVSVAKAWTNGDEDIERQFELARNAQPYIYPESITTDRGKAYVSRHFSDACRSLGIGLTLAAEYTPTDKAKVERQFRSIRTMFTQWLVGYVGPSTLARGKKSYSADQLLTLEQLQELLEDWIAVTWQNRPHKGLRDPAHPQLKLSPNQMLSAYREIAPELHAPFSADTYISLLPTEWRRINADGVTIAHRRYDSESLRGRRRARSEHSRYDGKWPFRVDPYNPMTVWLDLGDEKVPLPWMSAHADTPMFDELWRVARAQALAAGKADADNEVMRRYMNQMKPHKASRQPSPVVVVPTDPMGVAKQLEGAHERPTADTNASTFVKTWPEAPPLGFTP